MGKPEEVFTFMGKIRFIDSDFYRSPFVRSLKGPCKALYSFIICDCDNSGIWIKDLEAASLYIGFQISEKDFAENFIAKNKAVQIGHSAKYFFPDFIEHQYPKGLQPSNPAHKGAIETLKKYQLIDGACKPLKRTFNGPLDIVIDKDKDIDMVIDTVTVIKTKAEKFEKPTIGQIEIYLQSKYPEANLEGLNRFAEKFWNHYENNGWKVGKNKMKNWQLCFPQWADTMQKDLFPNSVQTKSIIPPQKETLTERNLRIMREEISLRGTDQDPIKLYLQNRDKNAATSQSN